MTIAINILTVSTVQFPKVCANGHIQIKATNKLAMAIVKALQLQYHTQTHFST